MSKTEKKSRTGISSPNLVRVAILLISLAIPVCAFCGQFPAAAYDMFVKDLECFLGLLPIYSRKGFEGRYLASVPKKFNVIQFVGPTVDSNKFTFN